MYGGNGDDGFMAGDGLPDYINGGAGTDTVWTYDSDSDELIGIEVIDSGRDKRAAPRA